MGDDLYMLKGDVVGNYFIGYSEQLKKEVRLESGIMRPELKGEDVKMGTHIITGHLIEKDSVKALS